MTALRWMTGAHGVTVGVLLVALRAITAHAEPPLPQRNVLVEWRMSAAADQQSGGAGLRSGEVVVDSRTGLSGRGTVVVSSSTRTRTETTSQQIQVLNGGQARLYFGTSRPVTQWQFALAGQGRGGADDSRPAQGGSPAWQAWSSTTWVDTGRGFSVRPRWTGETNRVVVELEARLAQAPSQSAYAPEGQIETAEIMTTLQMPLRVWTAVGKRSRQAQQRQRGAWSTQDLSQDEQEVLELRISVP